MNIKTVLTVSILLNMAGCASLAGVEGKSEFACKAPDGVLCESMTGILANAEAHNLPAQQVKHKGSEKQETTSFQYPERQQGVKPAPMTLPQYSGAPFLRNPKTLRVWIAPWESSDRTLFDQSYMYMVIDNWNWEVEHNQRRLRDAYAPVRPPVAAPVNPTARATALGSTNQTIQSVELPTFPGAGNGQ